MARDTLKPLARRIGARLKKRNLKLATAESCTGGWIAQAVTSVSGSSEWFDRGFVTYSDEAKKELLGVRLRGLARSAIDVSDGLLADLGHILEASRVGAELAWESLPRARAIAGCPDKALADDCLLAGGDDYELLFTASKLKRGQIEAVGRDLGIPLALIGAAVPGESVVRLRDARGKLVSSPRKGFDHFA